jgi:very-short-patch-repair endonuclease
MSLPEVLLWRVLRARPGGLKFRRQHPAGLYVLDFFCASRRLAIEIDGEAHNQGDRPARDEKRDAWLTSEGITVCRIPAREVLADIESVVTHIVIIARGDLPLHQPAAGPPPPPGEDL